MVNKQKISIMDKNRIIIILVIVILLLMGFISYLKIRDYNNKNLNLAYQAGMRDANIQFQQNIITQLNTLGFFTINLPTDNNKTLTVKLAPIQPQTQQTEK